MKWVNDRHPKFGQKVLVYCGGDDVQRACYDGDYISTDGCRIGFVSHWMEIPFPPAQTDDNPCCHCRHYMSWSEAQEAADRMNASLRLVHFQNKSGREWTAEDVMCDHEMEHCIPCSRKGE
jgi:hypothetical protein